MLNETAVRGEQTDMNPVFESTDTHPANKNPTPGVREEEGNGKAGERSSPRSKRKARVKNEGRDGDEFPRWSYRQVLSDLKAENVRLSRLIVDSASRWESKVESIEKNYEASIQYRDAIIQELRREKNALQTLLDTAHQRNHDALLAVLESRRVNPVQGQMK